MASKPLFVSFCCSLLILSILPNGIASTTDGRWNRNQPKHQTEGKENIIVYSWLDDLF